MNFRFLLLLFFILFRIFFPFKEQVCTNQLFFLSEFCCHFYFFDLPLKPLRKWQKAELSFWSTHHCPPLPSKPTTSHHIPNRDQKGTLAVQILFISKNLKAGPLALHVTGHVY